MRKRTFQVDFEGIRDGVSIERMIPILDLQMTKEKGKNEYRGRCPACNTENDCALQITPDTRSFRCYAANRSGDVTGLVAHIKGMRMLEAGRFIHAHFHPVDTEPSEVIPITRPQEPASSAGGSAPTPVSKATGNGTAHNPATGGGNVPTSLAPLTTLSTSTKRCRHSASRRRRQSVSALASRTKA